MRRQGDDGLGQGGGEQQGAAIGRRGFQDELQILAKAHVEHLVGLVQHRATQAAQFQRPALDMVAQAPGRAHHDMGAARQFAPLLPRIHAADARDDARAGIVIEPAQLALHLQRQFAGGCDDQRQGIARGAESGRAFQQGLGHRQPEGDGLARPGLGGNQQVAALGLGLDHRALHRGGRGVVALGQGAGKGGMGGGEAQTELEGGDLRPLFSPILAK